MNRSLFSLVLVASALSLTGCEKLSIPLVQKNWLVGSWVLDREKTVEAFSRNNQRETPVGGIAGEIAAAAILKTVDAMIKPMENVEFVFTEDEFIEKAAGYTKPVTYQIVDRPAPGQIKILDSNDRVRVFHQEEEHIWYLLGGKRQLQVYLKPVPAT